MKTMDEMTQPPGARYILLASFLGACISMPFVHDMSKKQRAVAILSSMAMSFYLSPLIAFLFANDNDRIEAPVGFLIGLFGMSICGAIFKAIEKSDIWGLIDKRFSKGGE